MAFTSYYGLYPSNRHALWNAKHTRYITGNDQGHIVHSEVAVWTHLPGQKCFVLENTKRTYWTRQERTLTHLKHNRQTQTKQSSITRRNRRLPWARQTILTNENRITQTNTIHELKVPTLLTELILSIELWNIFCCFIRNFLQLATSLNKLLRKEQPAVVGARNEEYIAKLDAHKITLIFSPALELPYSDGHILHDADACDARTRCNTM